MAIVRSSEVQIDKPTAVLQDNTGVLILYAVAHSKLNYRRGGGIVKKWHEDTSKSMRYFINIGDAYQSRCLSS